MPLPLTDYEVTTPDGQTVKFRGPSTMTDDQVKMRAQQESAFQRGAIPTTYGGGVQQSVGDTIASHAGALGGVVGGVGVLTAQPEIVAAAPLVGRGIQAGGEALAHRPLTPTSLPEVGQLAAEGAIAGYGPQVVAKGLEGLAAKTVPHIVNGRWVPGVKGSGVLPWAVRSAGELSSDAANLLHAGSKAVAAVPTAMGIAQNADALAADLKTMTEAVKNGRSPSYVALSLSANDPAKFSALMTAYLQSRQVK